MNWRNLFHVETLDIRFASRTGEPLPNTQPSRWNTPEYYVYYAFFLTIPVLMFKAVYDVSQPSHPTYKHYEGLLSPGLIPGSKVDNSDDQYRGFRDNIPYMAILLIMHPLLRRGYEVWQLKRTASSQGSANQSELLANGGQTSISNSVNELSPKASDARLQRRVSFDLGFALVFIVALHGISAPKVLLILYLNYAIATASLPKQTVGVLTWAFNITLLFANELCRGYPLASISPSLAWLDSYGGLVPRWDVLFNITILRLIAFNFDYLWSLDRRASSPVEKKNLDPANLSERDRVNIGAKPEDFTFRNYLAYVLYSPLYLIGPIINFNDYISQSRYQMPSINRERIIPYAARFLLCLLTMELVLHNLYAVAISKASPNWNMYTPFQLSMLGYFNLHIIWLKLLIPWRFFRLWSLLDGIDPPENMVRCMSDNYSALAFWRGWHRSFNRWIVRYIYVPLGGSQGGPKWRAALNYVAVFMFVAIWHDIDPKLLIWGWLVVLFVLPEVLARMAFPAKKWKDRPDQYRWLGGVGAVGNILMMMAAHLVGFAVGLDGLKGLVDGIVSSLGGRVFLIGACVTLFVGTQVMFEWRESERRRGVDMKC